MVNRKLTEDQISNIINLYKTGNYSLKKLGSMFSVCGETIRKELICNNVPLRTNGGKEKISDKELLKLYYDDNLTAEQIGIKFNMTYSAVCSRLRKMDEYKKKTMIDYTNHDLIKDYFTSIDNEFKAYILGFLITDGCIVETGNRKIVKLQIKSEDDYILHYFRSNVNSNNSIIKDKRGCSSFSIEDKQIVDDLSKYGVIPRKTHSCKLPKIDDHLMPHLIRGCIDGDGWITKYTLKRKNRKDCEMISIGFCGVSDLVKDLRDFLIKELGIYNVTIHKDKNDVLQCLWSSKKDVIKISHYIYDGANFYLRRKKEKIIDLL